MVRGSKRNQLAAGILAASAIVGGWLAGSYIDGSAQVDPAVYTQCLDRIYGEIDPIEDGPEFPQCDSSLP